MLRLYREPETPEQDNDIEDLKDQVHARLMACCQEDEATGCVIFCGPWQAQTGLGLMKVQGTDYTAHRLAAWVYLGGFDLDDKGVRVLHTGCPEKNPACIAWEHLEIIQGGAAAVARAQGRQHRGWFGCQHRRAA